MYFAFHVADTGQAKAFYGAVFGWSFESRGDYHHIAGSSPAGGIVGGGKGIAEVSFVVGDIGKAVAAATERGGVAGEPVRSESGWSARVEDEWGGSMEVWQPAEGYLDLEPRCESGDLFYFVLPVANEQAKGFYGDVLGWEFTPGSHPGGWNIVNVNPPGGMFVGGSGPVALYFRVEDVDAVAERVRVAGGTAGAKEPNSVGWHAACVDDQGVSFSIGSLRQG